jgi:transposase
MLADALGRPLKAILTPGQAHDVATVPALLDGAKGGSVIADKGYDTNDTGSLKV